MPLVLQLILTRHRILTSDIAINTSPDMIILESLSTRHRKITPGIAIKASQVVPILELQSKSCQKTRLNKKALQVVKQRNMWYLYVVYYQY